MNIVGIKIDAFLMKSFRWVNIGNDNATIDTSINDDKKSPHPGHCGVDVGLSEGTKVDLELLFKVIPIKQINNINPVETMIGWANFFVIGYFWGINNAI